MEMHEKKVIETVEEKVSHMKYVYPGLAVGIFFAFSFFGLFTYVQSYSNRTLPGLSIGDISIAKMEFSELKFFLDDISQKLISDGIRFDLRYPEGKEQFTLVAEKITESNVIPYISLDTEKEARRLVEYGKNGSFLSDAWQILFAGMKPQSLALETVTLRRDRLAQAIHEKISDHEAPPRNASLVFTSYNPVKYTFTSSTNGYVYPIDDALDQVLESWKFLQSPSVALASVSTEAEIQDADLEPLLSSVSQYFSAGPLVLKKETDTLGVENQWKISAANFAPWMIASDEGGKNHFTLDSSSTVAYLEKYIAPDVFKSASNGKFSVDAAGKVTAFEASQKGISLDTQKTFNDLRLAFENRLTSSSNTPVSIYLVETDPEVSTGSINDFGIKDILGVGISSYAGSPVNRIKNIKNALQKINGILIKPGEEFSAIASTQPYTLESGYLPEKVIKGDEIKAEIAGGLCQVGTTLFRMAMNSGMKITERRNHSLVVSYYNDPRNGQPGTDATIYEPSPDFRFLNDTANYVLIQTEVNDKTGELKFTLWGTDDSRKASYSRPIVSKWLPTGPTKFIETAKLAPGKKECQHAYPGAQASFTYTRTLADGTKEEVVYDSYYRPLPEICLVGKAVAPPPEEIPSDAEPIVDAAVPGSDVPFASST
jgi:vancomycin resistance protein YoaR